MASKRPSAQERGYTGAWQKASAGHLRRNPWCVYCAERKVRTRATLVDHRIPHRGDMKLFWDTSNWASSCAACHDGPKRSAERNSSGIMRGCDENGNPLDARHVWNSGERWADVTVPKNLKPSRIPLVIVYGPAGSGKSHYVEQHAGPQDLVIDLDHIKAELSGLPLYHAPHEEWVTPALKRRNALLLSLSAEPAHPAAWFIVSAPKSEDRKRWADMLKPVKVVMFAVPAVVCIERIRKDPRRRGFYDQHVDGAVGWWKQYTAG